MIRSRLWIELIDARTSVSMLLVLDVSSLSQAGCILFRHLRYKGDKVVAQEYVAKIIFSYSLCLKI
jgi:hypothetical protein